jgi:glycosyltransferase involved in cell wall biosynthesis
MKSVLFLIQGQDMPSSRVRVLNLLDGLKARNWQIKCIEYPKKFADKINTFRSFRDFDIIYLQKKLPSVFDTFLIRFFAKKLVFDFDDSIFLKHENSKKKSSFSGRVKFRRIVSASDRIVAGNRILAGFALELNKNVSIIPSVVNTDVPHKDNYETKKDVFTVGWVGGNINLTQLELLEDVLCRLSQKIPLELAVISGKPPQMDGVNVRFIPWDVNTQEAELAKLDAGLMPLPDSPHARGKCGYKAIQYMAAGVTPIVSDVGVNKDIVIHGETGLVAENIDDFYNHIMYLYQNPEVNARMGKNARKRAEEHYSLDTAVDNLDRILTDLFLD